MRAGTLMGHDLMIRGGKRLALYTMRHRSTDRDSLMGDVSEIGPVCSLH